MTSVNVGSTNIDGTGSAKNLSDVYSVLPLLNESTEGEGFSASLTEDLLAISANYWNTLAAKELQVTAKNLNIEVTDFVDVDINLESSEEDVEVTIYNSKRGEISTGSGDDTVVVTVQSNDAGWGNEFVVSTGEGDDNIIFENVSNSHLTELNIDGGDGDDYIDISALNANVGSADERIIDAGEGDYVIFGADGSETIFGGSGDDTINAGDGDDVINAGEGHDYIVAGDGDDVINAGEGHDYIVSGGGDDYIVAGEGRDFIDAGEGNDIIYSGSGSDGIIFDSADEKVDAGEGLDILFVTGDSTIVNVENVNLSVVRATFIVRMEVARVALLLWH